MTPPQDYIFKRSGLRITSDASSGTYRLGPSSSFQDVDGQEVAAQMDQWPVDKIAAYSSFPAEAPGWIVAIGRTSSQHITVEAAHASQPLAHRPSTNPQASAWESVDQCLLQGGLWAAQIESSHQWLRVDDGTEVDIYFRLLRNGSR